LRRSVALVVTLLLAAGTLAGAVSARPAESARTADAKLTLVAYSTPREAYGQIIPLEAIFANRKGQKVPFVIPRSTILIENPVAVVRKTAHPREANAFFNFLRTPAAQKIYGENGYRPVVKRVARQFSFPARPGIFTINQLGIGGWAKVQKQFFDARNGIFTKIQAKAARG
jgi:ABC-type sulfate transport system substrate-binding protein